MRPQAGKLLRVERGHFRATERTLVGRTWLSRLWARARRILIGPPLTTADLPHERLSKVKALAVFASDALSSSAYATEEILVVLAAAGALALWWTVPISLAIAVLAAIVVTSYRQTIRAYPLGGGSYMVTKDNLGVVPSLIAASSLLVGYTLTVAVSISAGVAALTSAVPMLFEYRVLLAALFIMIIMLVNMRGVRESGTIFAAPTYAFIVAVLVMIGAGAYQMVAGAPAAAGPEAALAGGVEAVSLLLLLRAFSAGAAALTGTEAIADGVPAFKPPEWKNAQITLTWMAVILSTLFVGISILAVGFHVVPKPDETVVSQVARLSLGGDTPAYYVVQAATMLILILAANTAFADFPRLSYFLARDDFMPHQFLFRGDRLAFSTGIAALAVLATLLVLIFRADTHALIPLYAVGVFISFTFSQASMVRRWWATHDEGWRRNMVINGIGAATTGMVTMVVAITRFQAGAWMTLVILPIFILMLLGISRHYRKVGAALALGPSDQLLPTPRQPYVIVPLQGLHRGTLYAVNYARSISPSVVAVTVTDDVEQAEKLRQQWGQRVGEVPLVILESPYRTLMGPLLAYIDAAHARHPDRPITVVLPEFVPRHWWEFLLHNQTALRLKAALFFRPNTAVVDVPYHLPE